jgi:hypothetical protein
VFHVYFVVFSDNGYQNRTRHSLDVYSGKNIGAGKYGYSVSEIDMLEEALGYPLEDEDRLKTFGIGGLLFLAYDIIYYAVDSRITDDMIAIPFLLVLFSIALCLSGYSVRVLRMAALEEETVPSFTDWGSLVIDGLKLPAVGIAYMLPTVLLFALSIIGSSGEGLSLVSLLLSLAASAIGLVALFFLPVAWTNLALTNRLGGAFEFGNIVDAALTGRYVLAVLVLIVLGTIFNVIATLLVFLLIGVFIQFYVMVFLSFCIGNGCGPKLHEKQKRAKGTIVD